MGERRYTFYEDFEAAMRFYRFCISELKLPPIPREWGAHVKIESFGDSASVTIVSNRNEDVGTCLVNSLAEYCMRSAK